MADPVPRGPRGRSRLRRAPTSCDGPHRSHGRRGGGDASPGRGRRRGAPRWLSRPVCGIPARTASHERTPRPLHRLRNGRTKGPLMPALGQRTGEDRTCQQCGTTFYCYPSDLRRGRGQYCSSTCATSNYSGSGNPKWRGGRMRTVSGYVYAYAPDHPRATAHGYVMEHRLVMEEFIGRYLEPQEQVHHINHVRDDNRPENLQLMANVHEHRRLHGGVEEIPCGTCGTPVTRPQWRRQRWANAYCSRRCGAIAGSKAAARKAAESRSC